MTREEIRQADRDAVVKLLEQALRDSDVRNAIVDICDAIFTLLPVYDELELWKREAQSAQVALTELRQIMQTAR